MAAEMDGSETDALREAVQKAESAARRHRITGWVYLGMTLSYAVAASAALLSAVLDPLAVPMKTFALVAVVSAEGLRDTLVHALGVPRGPVQRTLQILNWLAAALLAVSLITEIAE